MEVGTDALHELLLNLFIATLKLDLIWQLLVDVIPVFLEHQVRDLTSVKNVIDVFEEGLLKDV